jgi:hypothetical protein
VANYLPLETTYRSVVIGLPGPTPAAGALRSAVRVQAFDVGPDYFRTLGTALRGREFTDADDDHAAKVIIVNDAMARRWWPDGNVIGQTIRASEGDSATVYRVIGVAATGKYRTLGESPQPAIFRAAYQHDQFAAAVVVHGSAAGAATLASVRSAITAVDPAIAPLRVGTMDEQLAYALFPARVAGIVLSVIGAIGLLVAVTGLAASLAYGIARRTHEIGIRMALGAQRGNILWIFGRETGNLMLIGMGIGLPCALAIARLLRTMLGAANEAVPSTVLAVISLLVIAAATACWIPVRRAMHVDPIEAIRHE